MEATYWHEKWKKNNIAFHEASGNSLLSEFFSQLSLSKGDRVFVPLCGKTRDIAWLLSGGYRVVGAELSEMAVEQLFQEMDKTPEVEQIANLKRYKASNIDIYVGDIFDLDMEILQEVDGIYDRAALVALPQDIRPVYAQHLMAMTKVAPQLLISFEYEQSELAGPPFSISSQEIFERYNADYHLKMLASRDVPGGLKGLVPAREVAWLLTRR
ncbi:thiopurine S-methyltransferase [Microbulbifer variabilis]|uniref:Thiopurine S-methyltransferase n=1 Tax=Microbulbifer variabilis TaxID=266805 RepID=A0ABY4VEV2_9GAMM|nr:thiopurine S-methyltransferase [Microbulbifer variabilis]USD22848.1 thiopurine S-methyltransferase [Microbulbifer variabilis]